MIIVLERQIRDDHKDRIRRFLEQHGFRVREIVGEEETIFGAVGQLSIDHREVEVLPGVVRVIPISKPFKLASRELKREDTIVPVGDVKIGSGRVAVIAGPCSVENPDVMYETAEIVKRSGGVMLRGGAFKPRTSPYAFQGSGEDGLKLLREVGDHFGMPIVSEIVSSEHYDMMREYVDVFQIGTRNMQNFELLKVVGAGGMPVILKRGLAATIQEWLMAAEYLLAHGSEHVILCERGIRTFETATRNTLDISAIPVAKKLTHLPIMVDPSHATGIREKVSPVALASIAAGADGLLVEVHPRPEEALSDGPQTLFPEQFERLMRDIEALCPVVEKQLSRLPEKGERRPQFSGMRSPGSEVAAAGERSGREVADGERRAEELAVAFQGEHGAYSEIALRRFFQSDDIRSAPCSEFRDVFDSVLEGKTRFGVLPIENSLSGSIHENYDLLLQYPDLRIVGEIKIRIIHSLIAVPGAELQDIERVYSHPQGFAQCARFLAEHPNWERVPFYDTAGSVAHIAREGDKRCAAIAGAEAARAYGMHVIKEGLETNPQNYTRFVVLVREEYAATPNPDKASIVFTTSDTPGALFECLRVIAERKLNMKKLESRPILGKPWHPMFYVDMEIPSLEVFEAAYAALGEVAENLRLLGTYRAQ